MFDFRPIFCTIEWRLQAKLGQATPLKQAKKQILGVVNYICTSNKEITFIVLVLQKAKEGKASVKVNWDGELVSYVPEKTNDM